MSLINGHVPGCPCVSCKPYREAQRARESDTEAARFARLVAEEERADARRSATDRNRSIAAAIAFCVAAPLICGGALLGWTQAGDDTAWPLRLLAALFLAVIGDVIAAVVLRGLGRILQEHSER